MKAGSVKDMTMLNTGGALVDGKMKNTGARKELILLHKPSVTATMTKKDGSAPVGMKTWEIGGVLVMITTTTAMANIQIMV